MNCEDCTPSIERIRLQIGNPCEPWRENPVVISAITCDGGIHTFEFSRANCHNQKIIAWFYHGTVSGDMCTSLQFVYHNFGKSYPCGKGGAKSQVVCRIVGHCLTTEIRNDENSIEFEQYRKLLEKYEKYGDGEYAFGEKKQVYCNCTGNTSDVCKLGLNEYVEVVSGCCINKEECNYYGGKGNPIEDLTDSAPGGLKYNSEHKTDYGLFVEYGTKNLDNGDGNIYANCVTDTPDIYFIYIPCGHYVANDDKNAKPNFIESGAFSGLTNLRGIWIDGNNGECFGFKEDSTPFQGCEDSLEIVYCPSKWEKYFAAETSGFRKLKFINGKPYDQATHQIRENYNDRCERDCDCS
jgi:hypothetical protein